MIEARIYAEINGNPRTFVGKGKNSNEADRNARRKLHIYVDTNGDSASFEDNRVTIIDTRYMDADNKPVTLAEGIFAGFIHASA